MLLYACGKNNGTDTPTSEPLVSSTSSTAESTTRATTTAASGKNKDYDTYIILDDEKTAINGKGADFNGNVLTISSGGSYHIKGSLTDGKIYVNTEDESKKVRLYLAGVDIYSSDDAPIYIESSPEETVIHLVSGTVNSLSDNGDRAVTEEDDLATAAVYSKDDLQLEGEGVLNIKGNFNKGIFSKDDIDIRGGVINIESADDGIRGKESVDISSGVISITCGGDGIRTSEEEEEDKGNILITGGEITIVSDLDGIQATADLEISGGKITVTADSGATGNTAQEEMMPSGGRPGKPDDHKDKGGFIFTGKPPADSSAFDSEADSSPSTKGIKAEGTITLRDCDITVSSTDDSLHATEIIIDSGSLSLSSDDDGIHGDEKVTVNDGDIHIVKSYEGIEAKVININDGNIMLKSSDDGLNAADGSSSSKGMGMPQADASCKINISGGFLHINADGDGVDSNGSVDMTDGTVIVFGPQNGANGALDYAGLYTVSGGTLLALGSSGMAQNVTGDGVEVLAFNYQSSANNLHAIVDSEGSSLIGFNNPKSYSTVIFASDTLRQGEEYSLYSGGSFSTTGIAGVYLNAEYTPGSLVGALS